MEDRLNQLFNIYQAWISLAQEARHLATDEADQRENEYGLALMGYYTAIAEVWESAAGDLLQWLEERDTTKAYRKI